MNYRTLISLKPAIEALYTSDMGWALSQQVRDLKVAWEASVSPVNMMQKECYATYKDKGAETLQIQWELILEKDSGVVLPSLDESALKAEVKVFRPEYYDCLVMAGVLK